VDAPYREAEVRPEATPLRRSKWAFATALLFSLATGAVAYVAFRYVAAGWIGYAVAGGLAILALLSVSDVGRGRIGACPQCATPVEVRDGAGYLCPTCKTFLEVDRTQLLASREDVISPRPVFGVEGASFLHLPDSCCVCMAPATRKIATKVGVRTLDVPYCAEHERGIGVRGHVMAFRSLPYARATSQGSNVALVGRNDVNTTASDRWLMFFIGALMTGGAAATYFWLSGLERQGYVIVPASPKGILAWIAIKLLGWGWLALGLMAIALACFGAFAGSFKPARKPPAR
jgi:hypothetical protein